EILVIDDGSSDQTGILAAQAGARVVTHPQNRGYGGALKTGIQQATYDTLVFFDGDGQHDPTRIAPLLEVLGKYLMAVGARPPGQGPRERRAGKWLLHQLANILVGFKIPDLNSGLRAINRRHLNP